MYIIAGLGNPGQPYEGTRHNAGFDVIDVLAREYNISVDYRKNRALIGKGIIEGRKVILAKPQTYMNLRGESIRGLVDYYKDTKKRQRRRPQRDQEHHRPPGHGGVSPGQGGCGPEAKTVRSGGLCPGTFFRGGERADGGGLPPRRGGGEVHGDRPCGRGHERVQPQGETKGAVEI